MATRDRMDPRRYSVEERLRDGARVTIRAIRPDDKAALLTLFDRLSPETIYYRFHGAKKRLSRRELIYLTELDFHRKAALVAALGAGADERIVGVARYALDPQSSVRRAEFALTVEDAHQGRGIGRRLLEHLARLARAEGFEELEAFVLADNLPMIRLLERSGRVLRRSAEARVCHLVLTTSPEPCPASGAGGSGSAGG